MSSPQIVFADDCVDKVWCPYCGVDMDSADDAIANDGCVQRLNEDYEGIYPVWEVECEYCGELFWLVVFYRSGIYK